jgi:hypothetical protein
MQARRALPVSAPIAEEAARLRAKQNPPVLSGELGISRTQSLTGFRVPEREQVSDVGFSLSVSVRLRVEFGGRGQHHAAENRATGCLRPATASFRVRRIEYLPQYIRVSRSPGIGLNHLGFPSKLKMKLDQPETIGDLERRSGD